MRKFDTKVQDLKYQVLREVARHAWRGDLVDHIHSIPKDIIPGKVSTMRCCVYKERAILAERVHIAMGGDKDKKNVIQVIDIACDECPAGGYVVTDSCRGCLAHRCEGSCPKAAISFDEHLKAHIDKNLCVNCGRCAQVCPYNAIANHKRPCENACKIDAISMAEDGSACIDDDKCIACGACVYQCPFGAITDQSFILDVVEMLSERIWDNVPVYAVVAPSIASQFNYAHHGQVVAGIRALGFTGVVEAALGADMVAWSEAEELMEKGMLTSSCCPAFVDYIEKFYPEMKDKISHNLSPMAAVSKFLKEREPGCRVVFIGPCTAKKMEFQKERVRPYVDSVITFEELQALFDSRDIDITGLPEEELNTASYFGRIFARSGGVSDAVTQSLKEHGKGDFPLMAVPCDGIEQCRIALLKASKGRPDGNFIEGMACVGGCIGGAGCLTHEAKSKSDVDKYGREATRGSISAALSSLKDPPAKH